MKKNEKILLGITCVSVLSLTAFFLLRGTSSKVTEVDDDVGGEENIAPGSPPRSKFSKTPSPPNSPEREILKCCTVSAPGKALITGGYLVLLRPNLGIVVSTTARFYSTVKLLPIDRERNTTNVGFLVESPQFHATFQFDYNVESNNVTLTSGSENKFIEKCLWIVLSFARKHLGEEQFLSVTNSVVGKNLIGIKLRADNDFYSQTKRLKSEKKELLSRSLLKLPKFSPCPLNEDGSVDIAKTGMGSSAALTASFVGALLQWFGIIKLGLRDNKNDNVLVHNLAQLSHAIAQEKCGSGFDISAAIFGTQMYTRFDESCIKPCLEPDASPQLIFDTAMSNDMWNQTMSAFTLPAGIDIVMGDVCGGSSSTAMARDVLKWHREKPMQSASVWAALAEANKLIHDALIKLKGISQGSPEQVTLYTADIEKASSLTADKWALEADLSGAFAILQNIRRLFKRTRFWLKRMGDNAGVGIEPDSQTALADRTESLHGVLCAGVPGAGGNDAVFAIVLSRAARDNVERVWSSWETSMRGKTYGTVVCPLTLSAGSGINVGLKLEPTVEWILNQAEGA